MFEKFVLQQDAVGCCKSTKNTYLMYGMSFVISKVGVTSFLCRAICDIML